jgi:hypothetical protein
MQHVNLERPERHRLLVEIVPKKIFRVIVWKVIPPAKIYTEEWQREVYKIVEILISSRSEGLAEEQPY